MHRVTHSSTAKKDNQPEEPTKPTLKIKLNVGQVQTAVRLARAQNQKMAVEKAAAIEEELRLAKEKELQEAFQVVRPVTPRDTPAADEPLELTQNDGVDDPHGDIEREPMGRSKEGVPLFLDDVVEDQFSPTSGELNTWEDEPEWTGFSNSKITPMAIDNTNQTDKPPPPPTKSTRQTKPKRQKPLFIRDLIETQICKNNQSTALESKKRKFTEVNDQRAMKKPVLKSTVNTDHNALTIRPGFLTDDDNDTIQCERKVVCRKERKVSKAMIKITHENAPSTAEAKRKKSSIPSHYLNGFDTRFVPELIKQVSEDTNPWQPTFDADLVIAKIRNSVYPHIKETFEGKHPLAAPAFSKVTNWRAAIGRRAMSMVRAYLGDESAFETADEIAEHVSWLLPSQDIDDDEEVHTEEVENEDISIEEIVRRKKKAFNGTPFLWENGLIGVACAEPPSGYLLSSLVLETFAIHFETTGINLDPVGCNSRPVGALALALAAVERAISCWATGKEEAPTPFSQVQCGEDVQEYVDALVQISENRWEQVLVSTRHYTTHQKQAVVKQAQKKPSIRARVPAGQ